MWMKQIVFAVILALFATARVNATIITGGFQMNKLETDDLRLLYFDPHQTWLTPHVGRSFHNSLDFQKQLFNWTPWDKTTLLLKDFTDYGIGRAQGAYDEMVSGPWFATERTSMTPSMVIWTSGGRSAGNSTC
jgi:hypothetical protein